MDVAARKKSHLLSLPMELRLEIWRWTLSDPSVPDLVANIGRDKKYVRRDSATGTVIPRVKAWLEPGRNQSIGLGLLRTNKSIYEEALPLLYNAVRFAPTDHQGIFPLFLDSLSPYARSLIHHIKLHVPQQIYDLDLFGAHPDSLFHWAITCAQIAKLEGQLRDVEVEGLWFESRFVSEKTKYSILFPLCKIKTKKVFGPNNDDGMERLLLHASRELARKADLRRNQALLTELKDAVAKDRGETDPEEEDQEKGALEESVGQLEHRNSDMLRQPYSSPITSDDIILRNLSTVAGIDAFEKELKEHTSPVGENSSTDDAATLTDDWDLISYRSGASTPTDRPPTYMSSCSADSWTDVASTIAEVHNLDTDEDVAK